VRLVCLQHLWLPDMPASVMRLFAAPECHYARLSLLMCVCVHTPSCMHDVAHVSLVTVTASPLTVTWMLQYEGGELEMPDCHGVAAEVSVTTAVVDVQHQDSRECLAVTWHPCKGQHG
jgi:hypothetical protein